MAATLEELQKRRKKLLERIRAKGGDAPKLQDLLKSVQDQIRQLNGGGTGSTTLPDEDTEQTIANTRAILDPALDYGRGIANEFVPQGTFGTPINTATSPAMQDLLNRMNQYAQTSGSLTPLEQEALNNMRAGLGGYTGQETQAMREAAMQEINRQAQTQSRLAQIAQSRSGVRGASALAQQQNIGREAQQNVGNFERDLLIRNADEIQRRRQAFTDTVRGTEDARFGRQSTSNQMYGGFLGAEEAARTGREQYNNALSANEAMARAGTALSGAGTFAGTAGGQSATDLQRANLDAMIEFQKQQMEQNRRQIEQYYNLANRQLNNVPGATA